MVKLSQQEARRELVAGYSLCHWNDRQEPWFSAAILATLALGMGANTTVFSLVNPVLFKPLPFPGGAANVPANRDFMPHGSRPVARRGWTPCGALRYE